MKISAGLTTGRRGDAKSVGVEVLPIIGKGQPEGHTGPYDSKLFQPALIQGANAPRLLEDLRSHSAALETTMAIDGEEGVIAISQTSK
jgi:hypothetical protein